MRPVSSTSSKSVVSQPAAFSALQKASSNALKDYQRLELALKEEQKLTGMLLGKLAQYDAEKEATARDAETMKSEIKRLKSQLASIQPVKQQVPPVEFHAVMHVTHTSTTHVQISGRLGARH